MLHPLIPRLFNIVLLAVSASIVWGDDITIKCPVLDAGTALPRGVEASSCLTEKISRYHDGSTSATLYESEESWQQSPEKNNFTTAMRYAISRGVALVDHHDWASLPQPLNIHITIVDYARWSDPWDVTPEPDAWLESFHAGDHTLPGKPYECHLILPFPAKNDSGADGEWRRIQKNLISNMYHCRQLYYHPDLNRSDPPWWYYGTARYFDGLVWPATPEMRAAPRGHRKFEGDRDYEYPEEYHQEGRSDDLFNNRGGSSALFWHSAQANSFWEPSEVSKWVMEQNSTDPVYGKDKWKPDPGLSFTFDQFARAVTSGTLHYKLSSGSPQQYPINTSMEEWAKIKGRGRRHAVPVVLYDWDGWFSEFTIDSWTVNTMEVAVDTVSWSNNTLHAWYATVDYDPYSPFHKPLPDECSWAVRQLNNLTGSRSEWQSSGLGDQEFMTWEGAGPSRLEFLFTCTGFRWTTVGLQLKIWRGSLG